MRRFQMLFGGALFAEVPPATARDETPVLDLVMLPGHPDAPPVYGLAPDDLGYDRRFTRG